MTTILLAVCVVVCPLVMGAMMLGMRGAGPRKKRQAERSRGNDAGDGW